MKILSTAVPLMIHHIDTDQIIPADFLRKIDKKGFGNHLFYHWKTSENGTLNPDFPLNKPEYKNAAILLAGENFGCGSSREHAVWALADYGFKAVIAPGFADIFKGNACNNGLLPVELPPDKVELLANAFVINPSLQLCVDLEKQEVRCDDLLFSHFFEIDPFKKECLLSGKDEMDYLLSLKDKIEEYEKERAII